MAEGDAPSSLFRLEGRLREADLRDAALVEAQYSRPQTRPTSAGALGKIRSTPLQSRAFGMDDEEQPFLQKLCQVLQAEHKSLGDRLALSMEEATLRQSLQLQQFVDREGTQMHSKPYRLASPTDQGLRLQGLASSFSPSPLSPAGTADFSAGYLSEERQECQGKTDTDYGIAGIVSRDVGAVSSQEAGDSVFEKRVSFQRSPSSSVPSDSITRKSLARSASTESLSTEKSDWGAFMAEAMKNRPGSQHNGRVTRLVRHCRSQQLAAQPGQMQQKLLDFIQGHYFQMFCAAMIVTNALVMGVEVNVKLENAIASPSHVVAELVWATWINRGFTVFFTLELLLRAAGLRLLFLFGSDWRWNAFDSIIVGLSLLEEAGDMVSNISFLRILRGVRVVRVVRVIRVVRFFRDMRLMVCSIMQSLSSISWAMMLLGIIMYLFAICFMQASFGHMQDEKADEAFIDNIEKWFPNLLYTMLSLLMAISGGADWSELEGPLREISPIYSILFAFYIVFVVIGVLNVLTGVFVQRACELSGLDRDLVIQAEALRKESFLEEMTRIFEEADTDKQGSISWKEFRDYCSSPSMQDYLATQQLDVSHAHDLFKLFEKDGDSQEVSLEQFLLGCTRFRGTARSTDMANVLEETRGLTRRLRHLEKHLSSFGKAGPVSTASVAVPAPAAEPPLAEAFSQAEPDTGSEPFSENQQSHPFASVPELS